MTLPLTPIRNGFLATLLFATAGLCQTRAFGQSQLTAIETTETMTIDGLGNEAIWSAATWYPIDQTWIGTPPSSTDFLGKFKVVWDQNFLYVLTEITDEILSDDHPNPLTNWWDDDGIEIFLDENFSKGNHQFNYNAFAYHVSTFYDVVDLGTDQNPHLYNDHITTVLSNSGTVYTWECRIKIFNDQFVYGGNNTPVSLNANKIMGFSMAYNDNDAGTSRENFMGSGVVPGTDKNVGYLTADYFQQLTLVASGASSISPENALALGVKVYPNPASDRFTLDLEHPRWENLGLFSITGKQVLNQEIRGLQQVQVNVADFPPGIYLLKVSGAQIATTKLQIK